MYKLVFDSYMVNSLFVSINSYKLKSNYYYLSVAVMSNQVHSSVPSPTPVPEDVLPAAQHPVQPSSVSRNPAETLGLASFVAVTDPHHTFKQGNKADETREKKVNWQALKQ